MDDNKMMDEDKENNKWNNKDNKCNQIFHGNNKDNKDNTIFTYLCHTNYYL